nr:hypothetical protein CFP56_28826 [Quercus suber]
MYLLAQLHPRVHDGVGELEGESQLAQLHLFLVEEVLERLALAIAAAHTAALVADATALAAAAALVHHRAVVVHAVDRDAHALRVVRARQHQRAFRVQAAEAGVQLLAVRLGQLGAERIESDVDAAPVGLEREDFAHDVGGRRAADLRILVHEPVEVFQVVLVQRVAHDLDVHLVQVLVGQAAFEIRRQRRLDQHAVVEFFDVGRHAEDGHGLEPAERVTAVEQIAGVALVKGAGDEQSHIVDHVAVGQVFHELAERPGRIGLDVAEFGDELIERAVGEGGGGWVGREGGEEIAICGTELELDIYGTEAGQRVP